MYLREVFHEAVKYITLVWDYPLMGSCEGDDEFYGCMIAGSLRATRITTCCGDTLCRYLGPEFSTL
jgi:hypothetical protein